MAVAWLLPPAIANFLALALPHIPSANFSRTVFFVVIGIQFSLMIVAALVIAFFGVWLFDRVAEILRHVGGRNYTRHLWLESMYASSSPLPWAAAAGAAVWCVWIFVFFWLGQETPLISFAFGMIGHFLGALVYLNVFIGWSRLRNEAQSNSNNLSEDER